MILRRLSGLRGSMTALVTPFKNNQLDEEAFAFLCERQIERGTAALVPCGTTGEASTLDHDEQMRLVQLTVKTARGRVPVIAGAGSNCTRSAIDLARRAEQLGADAILCVVPYYNRPSQEGMFRHFQAVQACTGLPVLLYDVPSRTGAGLTLDTILRLAELPNIAGLKDAAGDIWRTGELRRHLGPDFLLLSGNDTDTAALLALGSQGCISVLSNIIPAACATLHRLWAEGDYDRFNELRAPLDRLAAVLFLESNPIPVKWILAQMGLISGELRLPLTPLASQHEGNIRKVLDLVLPWEAKAAARMAPPTQDQSNAAE